jgi:ABC-type nitrate/sulfonate/bicarbonate transport system substrate-binding protein
MNRRIPGGNAMGRCERRWLQVLAVAAAAVFVAAAPSGAATLRVAEPQAAIFDFVPLNVGMQEGIFAKHGVDIKIFTLRGAAEQQQALVADSVDIGLGSGPAMAFAARGATVKGVAEMAGKPSAIVLAVSAKGSIKTIADLKGKTLSISSPGSITEWLVRELERRQGWKMDAIKMVGLGSNSSQMAALRSGQTDGLPTGIFQATKFEHEGILRILVHFGDIEPHFIMHVIFASDKAIETKPKEIRNFLAGWFDTIHFMNTHKEASVKIAAKITRVPPDVISSLYGKVMPMFSTTGHFDKDGLDILAHSFVELKLLPKQPDMSTLYTEKFLPVAAVN